MEKEFITKGFFRWLPGLNLWRAATNTKILLRHIFLPMLCVLGWATTAQAVIPASERAVLTSFYTSTNGVFWTNKANWNGAVGTECTWFGVYCDAGDRHVVGIILNDNNLVGTLPTLSGIPNLEYFQVIINKLNGSIPSLSGLTQLFQFAVFGNKLSGSIPSLSGLPALRQVLAGQNQLTGPVPAAPPLLFPGLSDLCGNNLVSSGNASIDAAWVAAQAPEFVAGGQWLTCQIVPVFPMVVTGSITPTVANINAAIQYRPQDVGTTGSVYVFALAPASMVKNVSAEAFANHKGPVTQGTGAADAPLPCVLAQLTASGQLTAVTSGTLQAFLTGVLSSQGASVDVLKGVSTALISGAVFYVGYGSNSTSTINGGVHRNVVSVPGVQTCDPQVPQTGWWWYPAQDGRGFGIEVRGNTLFMSGYLYDDAGKATWMVAEGAGGTRWFVLQQHALSSGQRSDPHRCLQSTGPGHP